MQKDCTIFQISKKNGKHRTIYAPAPEYKKALRSALGELNKRAAKVDIENVAHGFRNGRNVVTNAKAHIAHAYTLSIDLSSFFDTVQKKHLVGKISKEALELCLIDDIARQGLPTSPCLANIAFAATDTAIVSALKKAGVQAVYTRYADDMAFSFDDISAVEKIKRIVKEACGRAGFKINDAKTELQSAKNGRRIITGISVGEEDVRATRDQRRRLRAAIHQGRMEVVAGMRGWHAMQEPKGAKEKAARRADEIATLSSAFKMGVGKKNKIAGKESIALGDDCYISGDPVQMLGMSFWTNGWKSCMGRDGQYRKGVKVWIECAGTRIAYAGNGKELTLHGVTRPQMVARRLVHTLEDGTLVYDRAYPSEQAAAVLTAKLREAGAISVDEARKQGKAGQKVGYAGGGKKPYMDSLRAVAIKFKKGGSGYRIVL